MNAEQDEPRYFSRFGGLWTDRSDASREIERRRAAGTLGRGDVKLIRHWIERGYVILRRAVDPAECDRVRRDIVSAWNEGDSRLLVKPARSPSVPLTANAPTEGMRVVDFYAYYESPRAALFSPKIARFLSLIFDDAPLLLQSLSFERGSEQSAHQDTGYVITSSPMELAASWIALEDIRKGSGELMYYEGSHRLPEYYFAGQFKHWDPERERGAEEHEIWKERIHVEASKMGLPLKTFLPRKGDALIWSADLAHGGSPVTDRSLTRRSLVGHYCPNRVEPHFFKFFPTRRTKVPYGPGYYCTANYTLTGEENNESVRLPIEPPTGDGLLRRLFTRRSGRSVA